MADANSLARVADLHADLIAVRPQMARIRDVLAGSDAVKSGGYLPTLAGHRERPDLASAYADRASFVGFSARTVEALTGAVMRKEPTVKVPARYQPRLANVNNRGDQLYGFSKKVISEVISYGRYGLLIDVAEGDGSDEIDHLPYIAGYSATSIINWRTQIFHGKPLLDQVILREQRPERQEFGSRMVDYYRVLELDENGAYRSRVIRNFDGKWTIEDQVYPTDKGGNYLDYVPFVFIGPNDLSPNVSRSPILDLVDVNLSHFRTSADLEQGRFFTSQPTPVIFGVSEDQMPSYRELVVGSGSVWLMPPGVTDARFLEYRGDGLGSLERALDSKADDMATMGARMLSEPRRGAEAAETVRLRNVSETSTLASIARTCADGIRTAMEMSCKWAKLDTGAVEFELNQDFIDATMEPQMLAQLMGAFQAGAMPMRDLFWNLQRGEMIRPGVSFEDYRAELDMEEPRFYRDLPLPMLNRAEAEPPADEDEAEAAD